MNRFWILKNPGVESCFAPVSDLINIPLFEIYSIPTIPLDEIRNRRFNLLSGREIETEAFHLNGFGDRFQSFPRTNMTPTSDRERPALRGRNQLCAVLDDFSFFEISMVSTPIYGTGTLP